MDPDQDGGRPLQQSHQTTKSMTTSSDGTTTRSNSSPVTSDAESHPRGHDSLVTVRLSEPPSLHVNTTLPPSTFIPRKSPYGLEYTPTATMAEVVREEDDSSSDEEVDAVSVPSGPSLEEELGQTDTESDDEDDDEDGTERPESYSSTESDVVNWEQLQKKEDLESKDQDADRSAASLLAKLEQENDKLATNPKSVKVQTPGKRSSRASRTSRQSRSRPPSMAMLRKMVNGPTPEPLRYSKLPPAPMTELDFYLALVKDPKQTAARLPTLLSNKIRRGIPPPLRGVVWQSMAGARDSALEEIFENLSGMSSPYEGVINKDLGRSFPGVDMFRDPEGDGQRMLGRVLKCFSLYDTKIGYCQGLGFLVGPLLMHMQDKQAFCVLVRLMENYDLRHCFVPDLSGLHVRIYQFRGLLQQHLPILLAHLDDLQVEPAYVSQWFLSFFAVTCPLPMLFRIYDVIFAEGASETIMRVALSLMRKNQARILGCTEMEDVMHLLLSRGLWDCYHYNADEFVQDFVALSDVVTKERLAALAQGYREAKLSVGANPRTTGAAAQGSEVATAASRFLGRLWASSPAASSSSSSIPRSLANAPTASPASSSASPSTAATSGSAPSPPSNTLSPGFSAVSRPLSMLRRSTSKQSLASTVNSMEAASSSTTSSAASVLSSVSTEATSISRDSAADDPSQPSGAKTAPATFATGSSNTKGDGSKYLHSQIEDLLTALSELQRNHALLASQLQQEQEEREEDRRAVRSLLDGLRKKAGNDAAGTSSSSSDDSEDTLREATLSENRGEGGTNEPSAEHLSELLDVVEGRFSKSSHDRRSSMAQTRSQLREDLARVKEQLSQEMAKTQAFNRKIHEVEQEVAATKDQLRESHAHVRNLHQEKQRLEKQIQVMRSRASDTPTSGNENGGWFGGAGAPVGGGPPANGLRELKLGRSRSTPSQAPSSYNKRTSTLTMQKRASRESLVAATTAPVSENDALLLELVQAKTAEAVARQEAEEAKQKLEQLRRAFGLGPGDTPPAIHNPTLMPPHGASAASSAASAAIGMFGRLTGSSTTAQAPESTVKPAASIPATSNTAAAGGGGFWGWRR